MPPPVGLAVKDGVGTALDAVRKRRRVAGAACGSATHREGTRAKPGQAVGSGMDPRRPRYSRRHPSTRQPNP
jgi:hypothetical protein